MSLYVSQDALLAPVYARNLPQELTGRITETQWANICDAFKAANGDSTPFACCCEWCVCCLSGCFPIFCFHQCISNSFMNCLLGSKINALNARLFHGLPVLSIYHAPNIGLIIRYDLLPNNTPTAIAVPIGSDQPIITTSQPVMVNGYNHSSNAHMQPTSNIVQQPKTDTEKFPLLYPQNHIPSVPLPSAPPAVADMRRVMQVIVPDWATSGSVLTVNSPEGLVLNITVPSNQPPGSTLFVNY